MKRKIHIEWKRSGIGFTRRQRASVLGLGLRRLHHVVERPDTPQVRGLVAAVPHLVEIVESAPKPAPWASIPEYTVHPRIETAKEETPAVNVPETEEAAAADSAAPAADVKEKGAKRKAAKPAQSARATGEAAPKKAAKKAAATGAKPAKIKPTKGKK
jgi:large subunit ribosomal protein L30